MSGKPYHLANIRALLLQGLDAWDLRQLCFDVPDFQPVYDGLARGAGQAAIVDRLLEHAERTGQLPALLALAEGLDPARYAHHGPYYAGDPTPVLHRTLCDLARRLAAQTSPATFVGEQRQPLALSWRKVSDVDARSADCQGGDGAGPQRSGAGPAPASLPGIQVRAAAIQGIGACRANLSGTDLRGANLHRANLIGASLDEANLVEANLVGANLSKADLSGANLSGANLSWAHLCGADLTHTVLGRANLQWADLSRARLSQACLANADLSVVNLCGVSLRGADLTGADLSGADLRGADLSKARVTSEQLARARSLEGARLPRDGVGA
jgi:uncharacterized protein YjbI with pentapeptide repeats